MKKISLDAFFGILTLFVFVSWLLYKLDSNTGNINDYWFLAGTCIVLSASLFLFAIIDIKKKSRIVIIFELLCSIAILYVPISIIGNCVLYNKCFIYRTIHYATPSNPDYWVVVSVQYVLLLLMVIYIIGYVTIIFKKRKAKKIKEILRQKRIDKRIQEKIDNKNKTKKD
jgi:hypothetical protein